LVVFLKTDQRFLCFTTNPLLAKRNINTTVIYPAVPHAGSSREWMLLITQPVPTTRLQNPPVAGQDPTGHLAPCQAATPREQPWGDPEQGHRTGDGGKQGPSPVCCYGSNYAPIAVSKITGARLKIADDGRVAKHVRGTRRTVWSAVMILSCFSWRNFFLLLRDIVIEVFAGEARQCFLARPRVSTAARGVAGRCSLWAARVHQHSCDLWLSSGGFQSKR